MPRTIGALLLPLLLVLSPRADSIAAAPTSPVTPAARWIGAALPAAATAAAPLPVPIAIGHSIVTLNGPWRFHTGDDPAWAEPGFDDSRWETADLTAPPGAHDSDVGLSGFVPGWTRRGHAGYSGYAWYRLRVAVTSPSGEALALAGPPAVDSAYQLFVDGRLLGGCGAFSGAVPTVYSVQPRMFPLPAPAAGEGSAVVAFRVWMGAAYLAAPDAGGIHIAPALGEAGAIAGRYRLQWLQTFCGYVVEVVEPIAFALLAVMAWTLIRFDRADRVYAWLIAALLLTAAGRLNQATFFWGQFESARAAAVIRGIVLDPLALGAWTVTWYFWFRLRRPAWVPKTAGALTVAYAGAQLLRSSLVSALVAAPVRAVIGTVSDGVRLAFVLLTLLIAYRGARGRQPDRWLSLAALVLVAAGLFAQELSRLHVPGIWFPWGTGVSRTQYLYAAFDVILFALLLRRLLAFAAREAPRREVPRLAPAAPRATSE